MSSSKHVDDKTLIAWIESCQTIGRILPKGDLLADLFCVNLETLIKNDWRGGCHDTSAALYMVLAEYGFVPTLCIGVVGSPLGPFDHSWVEVNGMIFDAAVSYPSQNGVDVGPPVFASTNVVTMAKTELVYGLPKTSLSDPASEISKQTLNGYAEMRPSDHFSLWEMAFSMGTALSNSMHLDSSELRRKYGATKRKVR